MKPQNKRTIQGFTLIELLIVIAILGFLIVSGISSYTVSLQRGRDAKRKNDVRQVGLALESFFADKGSYPLSDATGHIVGCKSAPSQAAYSSCAWGSEFTDGVTVYMAQLPQDATSTQNFYYTTDAKGTYYQIYTRLENTKDGDIPHSGDTPGTYTFTSCGIGASPVLCNYGYSSTNVQITYLHGIQF